MKKLLLIPAACALLAGCAKNTEATVGEEAKAYLDLMLSTFYPEAKVNENGIYLLEDEPGSGPAWVDTNAFFYATATVRTLDGTITSTSDEKIAQQLGTYAFGNYYGPKYAAVGKGQSYAGVDAMLKGMRIGGYRSAILPAWLLTTARYDSIEEYLDACAVTVPIIYSLRLEGQCADVVEEQIDSLRSYVTRHYGAGQEYTPFPENENYDRHFYFISDSSAFEGVDPRGKDTTLKINYTGRLLNGQVFDTTIGNVAKDAGIYSASRKYEPVSVTFSDTYTDISMSGNSGLIKGFQMGLYLMRWSGQKASVLFTSPLGYDTSGSGSTIPSYSPLLFELELL